MSSLNNILKIALSKFIENKSFKTKRKIVIIESDDWGSTRTKDIQTREKLNGISPAVANNKYIQYDSIATADDIALLYEVLDSVKDSNGNPACLTINVSTANPDFEEIRKSNFAEFHFNTFKTTLDQYSTTTNLFKLWQDGISSKLFEPQLHGREHLHALAWLAELRAKNKDLLKAFELEAWGIPYKAKLLQKRKKLQAALDHYDIKGESEFQKQWVEDSVDIFEYYFKHKPKSFIAPSYIWHSQIHQTLKNHNINTVQGIKLQFEPKNQIVKYKKKLHYTGQKDKTTGITFTSRNAFFEPYIDPNLDWVDLCFLRIDKAFKKRQPAIIGSHRINFVGKLDKNRRDNNLKSFKKLLSKIKSVYPEVEFMGSGKLSDIIK